MDRTSKFWHMACELHDRGYRVEFVFGKPWFYKNNDMEASFEDMKKSTSVSWVTDHYYHLLALIRSSKVKYVTEENLHMRSSYDKSIVSKFITEGVMNHALDVSVNSKGEKCCSLTRSGKWTIDSCTRPTDNTLSPVPIRNTNSVLQTLREQPMTIEELHDATHIGLAVLQRIINHLSAIEKVVFKKGRYQLA